MHGNNHFKPDAPLPCKTFSCLRGVGVFCSRFTALTRAAVVMAASSLLSPALAQAPCKTIQFERGAYSTTIMGDLTGEEAECFRFTTGNGQKVSMSLASDYDNIAFAIRDLTDPVIHYEFTSQKKTYQFRVMQFFASAAAEHYELTLSIK